MASHLPMQHDSDEQSLFYLPLNLNSPMGAVEQRRHPLACGRVGLSGPGRAHAFDKGAMFPHEGNQIALYKILIPALQEAISVRRN